MEEKIPRRHRSSEIILFYRLAPGFTEAVAGVYRNPRTAEKAVKRLIVLMRKGVVFEMGAA